MNWRVNFLLTFMFLIIGVLIFRLFSMSIIKHTEYVAQANEQQNIELEITPKRGDIYTRDLSSGQQSLVAQSVEVYSLSVTPKFVLNKPQYAAFLARWSDGLKEADILATLQREGMYMSPLRKNLTKKDVEDLAVEANAVEKLIDPTHREVKVNFDDAQGDYIYFINGIFFTRGYERVYPEGASLGQVLGFVNDKGQGQYGFEGRFDSELKGYAGKMILERDSSGNLLAKKDAVSWKDGSSYELSIDRNIQFVAEKELAAQLADSEAKSGSVTIMDPKTGEILAMANQPGYDPNNFRTVAKENINLFENPTISEIWEPGSIMKPLVMAAAIDQGLVTPDTTDTFGATVTVDGHEINTALRHAYGKETMTQVLTNSDNVAMVWVADKLGNQNLYNYFKAYGFGSLTGIDLEQEISSSILPVNQWRNINRATMAFGQGIAVTPLQILTAYSAIANGGKEVRPRVVHARIDENGNKIEESTVQGAQILKPETVQSVKDMMVATVANGHAKAGVVGYDIAGKTGTAQVPNPDGGGYIENAYNHSFIGFGPANDPKFLMLVKIDQPNLAKVGLYAEATAVPCFGRIAQFLVNYFQVPPTK